MTMMKIVIPLLMTMCVFPSAGRAWQRSLPARPEVETLGIRFNGETIKGFVLLIDSRTDREKKADTLRGHPAGPVIVFFPGHAQRPDDAYEFTGGLSILCRSGMVIVPVCDTPYGNAPGLHGDAGKDSVLMEMVRFVLVREGFSVEGYSPVTALPVSVNGAQLPAGKDAKSVRVIVAGWSHGAILARRFAHAYPASVCSLGQVCPAGYERWGPWGMTGRFASESLRICAKMGKGNAGKAWGSAWGFTRGFTGDFIRSVPSAMFDLNPGKAGRIFRDIRDCSAYCDSTSLSAFHLERIAVIFGADDTLMDPARQLGIGNGSRVDPEDLLRFRQTFFRDVRDPSRISLKILPGTHLAPVSHAGLYAEALLTDLGELAGN